MVAASGASAILKILREQPELVSYEARRGALIVRNACGAVAGVVPVDLRTGLALAASRNQLNPATLFGSTGA